MCKYVYITYSLTHLKNLLSEREPAMQEQSTVFLIEKLIKPANDVRSILRWGYPKFATIRFVADHSRLSTEERHILIRVIMPPERIVSRAKKKIGCKETGNRDLLLDGYNVLLTVDSLLKKEPMWFCDDSYIRDTRFYFSKAKQAQDIGDALETTLDFLAETGPKTVNFLLDAQISRSGELAGLIRRRMQEKGIPGDARTSKHVDFDLKKEGGKPENDVVVASSDGIIIDSVLQVLDIPACLMEKRGIEPLRLY